MFSLQYIIKLHFNKEKMLNMVVTVNSDAKNLCELTAKNCKFVKKKEISPCDLVEASIDRITELDTSINSLPIRRFQEALKEAKAFKYSHQVDNFKSLCGHPIAVKD